MTDEDDFNDVDELMSIDPLNLSKQNLDRIIAYQRKQRTQREQGVKTKKPRSESQPSIQLSELLAGLPSAPQPKPGTSIKRRF